jgi:hypothetical protein
VGSAAILLGLLLYVATILAIRRWVNAIPARVAVLIERERSHGEQRALDTLRAAAGERVAKLVLSLRDYEEQTAAAVRARAAADSTRARMAEGRAETAAREAAEALTVLGAASELVKQLRVVLDRAGPPPTEARDEAGDPQERRTVEMKPRAGLPSAHADDEPEGEEEERTKVAARPAALLASSSGLRLMPPRPASPPPPGDGGPR